MSDIRCFLDQLDDAEFSKPLPFLSDASIGQHTRHLLDGYSCLMEQSAEQLVNYDLRNRDPRIESYTESARQRVDVIEAFLNNLDTCHEIQLEGCFEDRKYESRSSMTRELVHNVDHTIHHLAIIKIGLKAYFDHVRLPDHFGVAPSTLTYRNEHQAFVE